MDTVNKSIKQTSFRPGGSSGSKARAAMLRPVLLLTPFPIALLTGGCAYVYYTFSTRFLYMLLGRDLDSFTVVSSIMLGLAAGSYIWGKASDLWPDGVMTAFAFTQMAAGLLLLILPFLIDYIYSGGSWFITASDWSAPARFFLQFIVSFAFLFPLSAMIGGIIPLAGDFLIQIPNKFGRYTAILFGFVMAGLAAGPILLHFFMAGSTGLTDALRITALTGLSCGLLALLIGVYKKRSTGQQSSGGVSFESRHIISRLPSPQSYRLTIIGLLVLGLCSPPYYFMSSKLASAVLDESVYSYAVIFSILIGGLSIGSLLAAPIIRSLSSPLFGFAMLQICIGVLAIVVPFNIKPTITQPVTPYWAALLTKMPLLMLVPPAMIGAAIPLGIEIYQARKGGFGECLGDIFGLLTLGAAVGSIAAGIYLLPAGIRHAGIVLPALNLLTGALILGGWFRRTPALIASAALFVFAYAAHSFLPPNFISGLYNQVLSEERQLYFQEGVNDSISVHKKDDGELSVYRNGVFELDTSKPSLAAIKLASVLPLLLHDQPANKLSIMPLDYSGEPKIETTFLDPVYTPDVIGLLNGRNGKSTFADSVEIINDDARHFLNGSAKRFSIISIHTRQPWSKRHSPYFTLDFYRIIRTVLAEKGVFVQTLSLDKLSPAAFWSILNTISQVFPNVSVWYTGGTDAILLCTPSELKINVHELERFLAQPETNEYLKDAGLNDPAEILSCFIADASSFEADGMRFSETTDDRPHHVYFPSNALLLDRDESWLIKNIELIERNKASVIPHLEGFDEKSAENQALPVILEFIRQQHFSKYTKREKQSE